MKPESPRIKGTRHAKHFITYHLWRLNYVIKRLKEVSEEYDIRVLVVGEAFASKLCPACGKPHEGALFARRLLKRPVIGLVFNAGLVGAFNILKRVVKAITPNLGGLYAQERGNGGKTSRGVEDPL